ncbi:MAG: copper amine oxidase N-terminal domain-containing protein [Syntrophomonas sp.]
MEKNVRAWYLCIGLILLLGVGVANQAWAVGNATFTVGSTSYYMDGVAQNMEVAPYVNNGRTYVPILYLAQALGVQTNDVVWDAGSATITLSKGDQAIQMQVGSKNLLVNGATRPMDVAPEIASGRTFLPASFVAQVFGYSVDWDAASQTIKLNQGSSTNPPVNNINTQAQTEPKIWEDWPAASTDDPNHPWTIVFKQAMDSSTINSINIYVSTDAAGGTRIQGVGVAASDCTHALVSPPTGGWSIGTNYYLIITQGVLTSEGLPLKAAINMPFSVLNKDSSLAAYSTQLTPDYWIPDLTKKYVYTTSCNYGQYPRTEQKMVTWSKDSQGQYIRSWDKYTWQEDGTLSQNVWSETDVYVLEGSSISWKANSGYIDQAGSSDTSLVAGTKDILEPVEPGQTWSNHFSISAVYDNGSRDNYSEEVRFVGMENIECLGVIRQAARITVNGSYGTTHYEVNYWLVKNIGIVKSVMNEWNVYNGETFAVYDSDMLIDMK